MYSIDDLIRNKIEVKQVETKQNGVSLGQFKSAFNGELIELIALFRGNTKIGEDFIQLSVLPVNGEIDKKSKGRFSICGNCPHHLINSCYAYDQGLFVMMKEYKKGSYKSMSIDDFLILAKSKNIRFGRFGDLSLLPFELIEKIANNCFGFTGYTNQWRSKHYDSRFNDLFMLSTVGTKDTNKALKTYPDARVFKVVASDKEYKNDIKTNFITCPSENGFKCSECKLCDGNSAKVSTVNIEIKAHGISYKTNNINKLLNKDK